jgi:succinate dehydrogenase hydrophobic anchor subunit
MSLTERRVVYGKAGTPTPFWVWIVQRASGILLGPIVVIHVMVPRAPFNVWLSSVLLAIILAHAFIGLWRMAAMRQLTERLAQWAVAASTLVVLVIAVFGIALLYSLH